MKKRNKKKLFIASIISIILIVSALYYFSTEQIAFGGCNQNPEFCFSTQRAITTTPYYYSFEITKSDYGAITSQPSPECTASAKGSNITYSFNVPPGSIDQRWTAITSGYYDPYQLQTTNFEGTAIISAYNVINKSSSNEAKNVVTINGKAVCHTSSGGESYFDGTTTIHNVSIHLINCDVSGVYNVIEDNSCLSAAYNANININIPTTNTQCLVDKCENQTYYSCTNYTYINLGLDTRCGYVSPVCSSCSTGYVCINNTCTLDPTPISQNTTNTTNTNTTIDIPLASTNITVYNIINNSCIPKSINTTLQASDYRNLSSCQALISSSCTSIPVAPCAGASWKGSPECRYDSTTCINIDGRDTSIFIYIGFSVIVVILISIIIYLIKRKKR